MSYELIAQIILVVSFLGMAVILFRKTPDLVKLSEVSGGARETSVVRIKNGIKNLPGVKSFSYEIFLQRMLSRIRVLNLKTENKTSGWLEKLRQKANQKNGLNNDKYWKELKRAKNGK